MSQDPASGAPLYTGNDWDYGTLRRSYDAIERIAVEELGLELYPNRLEVITSEQMLDVYTAHGMPLTYRHWSYGKRFLMHESSYRRGYASLAYEVVINSNPCISYLMEENTATMQALVIAHAAFGHNHFFRNNHLFRQWTEPSAILDYLAFARTFIGDCEDRYGVAAVERVLDAAHSLSNHGVHRHGGSRPMNLKTEQRRERERREYDDAVYNDLWRTLPDTKPAPGADADKGAERRRRLGLPEENLLYFLEKSSPRLQSWEREVIRIVRLIAQYFYPQPQCKLMNEGCATWVHQRIMTRLHETGRIDDAAFLEVLHSTSNVIYQPGFERGGQGFNPYALGYAMMTDIARICDAPTPEDRAWFPDIAGNGDSLGTLRHAWANYRDESFLLQFLSPKVIRDFRMFRLLDDTAEPTLLVDAIHDDEGYRAIRRSLARSYDPGLNDADVQVVDVNLAGDRRLMLQHRTRDGLMLARRDAEASLKHIAALWGYEVQMQEIDDASDAALATYTANPPASSRLI